MTDAIQANSLVTLHYRLRDSEDATFVGTFDSRPSTLQLGNGELAPPLEVLLVGLVAGDERTFAIDGDAAFGPRQAQMIQCIARADLPANAPSELLATLTVDGPGGQRIAGVIRDIDADSMLIDFNHPLSGRHLYFDVRIIGVL